MKRWRQRLGWCGYQPKNTKAASKVLAWNSRIYYFKLLELKSWCGQGGSRENCFLAFFNFLRPSAFLGSSKMYGKNHYNTVISLQLIKIKKKKNFKQIRPQKNKTKQNSWGEAPGRGVLPSSSQLVQAFSHYIPLISVPVVTLVVVVCCQVVSTLCNPMDCSIPGSPIFYYLLEFAQIHNHLVGDAF